VSERLSGPQLRSAGSLGRELGWSDRQVLWCCRVTRPTTAA
jgi:hypothetical protein